MYFYSKVNELKVPASVLFHSENPVNWTPDNGANSLSRHLAHPDNKPGNFIIQTKSPVIKTLCIKIESFNVQRFCISLQYNNLLLFIDIYRLINNNFSISNLLYINLVLIFLIHTGPKASSGGFEIYLSACLVMFPSPSCSFVSWIGQN